jgi:helix-turn-helix protein
MPFEGSRYTIVPPKWLRMPAACRYSGLSRSILYRLINDGRIKSVCVRDRNKLRGVRLIAAESIDRYLESIPDAESIPASRAASPKAGTASAPTQPEINPSEEVDSFSEFELGG